MSSLTFRKDINGLRAWAVVAVVLYHFSIPWFNGGFAGVDVFFVISGYLMCGIVLRGLDSDQFSLWKFYLSRARRIWPALIVVCIACLVAGWFLLVPKEYETLGKHVRDSVMFSSNLRYLGEAGYFDVASQDKWLLHTWSLSVEWQFYLLFPLLLLAVWKISRNHRVLFLTLLAFFLLSFIWNIWQTRENPAAAFFTLWTRAWELLAGSLVYLIEKNRQQAWRHSRLIELSGFTLIIATIFLINTNSTWPGALAGLPVLGTALVILAGRNESWWTANPVAQWLGSRSYSIYLWHWPLVVLLAYFEQLDNTGLIAAGILASLLLGHLSWHWIETPCQRRLSAYTPKRAAITLVLIVLSVALMAQAVPRSGIPERIPHEIAVVYNERENTNPRQDDCFEHDAYCIYGSEPIRAVLIGDSHADSVITAAQEALGGHGGILFRAKVACLIAFGMPSKRPECEELNEHLAREHVDYPESVPIIYVSRISAYVHEGVATSRERYPEPFFRPGTRYTEEFIKQVSDRYLDTICQLAEHRPVYLTRPTPEMKVEVPTYMSREMIRHRKPDEVFITREEYERRNAFAWKLQDQAVERCGAKILNPIPFLCDEEKCYGTHNGIPNYRDSNHLSESGNRLLVPMFKELFDSLEKESRTSTQVKPDSAQSESREASE